MSELLAPPVGLTCRVSSSVFQRRLVTHEGFGGGGCICRVGFSTSARPLVLSELGGPVWMESGCALRTHVNTCLPTACWVVFRLMRSVGWGGKTGFHAQPKA